MRPKKKILLIDSKEARRSVRAYTLTIKGFAVCCASNVPEAQSMAQDMLPDLAIVSWPVIKGDDGRWIEDMRRRTPQMRSMVLAEAEEQPPTDLVADAVLSNADCTMLEIFDRAKVLCIRRRGPKKFQLIGQRAVDVLDMAQRRIA